MRLLLAFPLPVGKPEPTQHFPVPPGHDKLDRDVWAIISDRYFKSWHFRSVVLILLAGFGVWGYNISTSTKFLSDAQAKLDEAKVAIDDAELRLQKAKTKADKAEETLDLRQADFDQKIKNAEKAIDDLRKSAIKRLEGSVKTEIERISNDIGQPEKIRKDIQAKIINETRNLTEKKIGELILALEVEVKNATNESIGSIASKSGTQATTLTNLVKHQLRSVERLDRDINGQVLAKLEEIAGVPFDSVAAFAAHRAHDIDGSLKAEAEEGKGVVFSELSKAYDTPIAGFGDLVRREIGAIESLGSEAAEKIRGAQARYLAEVGTAAQHIPSKIDIIDGRLNNAEGKLDGFDRRAETLTADIEVVTALREPLTRIAAHLGDPYLRSQISIATVLGHAGWLVAINLVFSILALGAALYAVRVWYSEGKIRARREQQDNAAEGAAGG